MYTSTTEFLKLILVVNIFNNSKFNQQFNFRIELEYFDFQQVCVRIITASSLI